MNLASARAGIGGFDAAMLFGRGCGNPDASGSVNGGVGWTGSYASGPEMDVGGFELGVNTFDFNVRGMDYCV